LFELYQVGSAEAIFSGKGLIFNNLRMFVMEEKSKYEVKCRLHKGDEVIVLTGKNKDKTGTIDRVDRKSDRVYIGGVNLVRRHTKPTMANQDGGIVEKVMGLHVSNVALIDPKTKKATRIGYKDVEGKKVRFAKKSGTIL